MKRLAIIAIIVSVLGYIGNQDLEQEEFERAEYCARVVAGVHTDYDHLCPANSYNTYSGLPGDVACVVDGSCSGG